METKKPLRNKIRWQCHRGMLELDLILLNFFDQQFDSLAPVQQLAFERLLQYSDPQLRKWLVEKEIPSDHEASQIITLITTHA